MSRLKHSLVFAAVLAAGRSFAGGETLTPHTLEEDAPVKKGYLGIQGSPIDPEDRADHGLKEGQAGILILVVSPSGPAEKAGLKAGDVLLNINGMPVDDMPELVKLVHGLAPGAEAKLEILRDQKPQTFVAKAGEAPKRPSNDERRKQMEEMLQMLPPEAREKVEKLQKMMSEKGTALVKKYKDQGLSDEEAHQKASEELKNDEEVKKLLEEVQEVTGGGPGGK